MDEHKTGWPSNIKKTRQRQSVLAILERSDKPLSAADICSLTKEAGEAVWLSTVYRILELFTKKGVVVKVSVLNNDFALYEMNRFEHKHYAVCVSCHKVVQMDNCPMERFIPEIEDSDFHVTGHKVEIYGYCKECDAKW
ncbi:MAG: transcriptional repressor [Synergistaceae bacterium]|jgi:Fur family ferric uptake transcriptional regulator|nr:transcriptional repressor [Synergistaceae bacterium]